MLRMIFQTGILLLFFFRQGSSDEQCYAFLHSKKPVNPDKEIISINGMEFKLKSGMSMMAVQDYFNKSQIKEKTYNDNSGLHIVNYITLSNKQNPSIDVYGECTKTDECIIKKIVIKDPDYKTSRGIGVGSTITQVEEKYQQATVTTIRNSVVVLPKEEKNMALVLEGFSIDWKPDGKYTMEDLPRGVKVVSIQLF